MAGRILATLFFCLLVAGCNEPVEFIETDEGNNGTDDAGNNGNNGATDTPVNNGEPVDTGNNGSPDVAPDATVIKTCEPSLGDYTAAYASIQNSCGTASCHGNRDGEGQYYVPIGDPPGDLDVSYTSGRALITEASCEDPEGSDLLKVARQDGVAHPINAGTTPGYRALITWLEAGLTITVVEPDVGMDVPDGEEDMGPDTETDREFPCDGLPTRDGLPYVYPFDSCPPDADLPCATFVEHVNPVLMQQCASGDCHGGRGNGFFLLSGDDECVPQWNYFSTYWYIDHGDQPNSPLLVRPVVDDPQDPHQGLGSLGRPGSCEYISLLKWLNPAEFPNWEPCGE
jgi:hypothetical protein